MPSERTVARRRLDEILADGAWHDRERLLVVLAPLVPPGQASRVAERNRRRFNPHGRVTGHDQAIAVGARAVVRDLLWTAVRFGGVEQRTVDGRVEYRQTPR